MSSVNVGVIQLTSVLDYRENLEKIQNLIDQGKKNSVSYYFLPECFYSMSDGTKPTPFLVWENNEHWENISNLAKKNQVYLLGGSVAFKSGEKILNRSLNFSKEGKLLGHYDKIHLFSCELGDELKSRKIINENDIYTSGHDPKMVIAGELNIGVGICFDLRFPQMWRDYAYNKANVLSISSAFTVPTGKAHWHTLVRARAIENQCFVIAAAQWGRHNDRIQTFGHSLIIDPWGEILADGGDGEKLLTAELNLSKIEKVRKSVKVF